MFRIDFRKLRSGVKRPFTRANALLVAELLGSAAICGAIAVYCWPAALGVAGVATIVAVERQPNV